MVKEKNILIITTSGGNGHLQAARAQKTALLKENPEANICIKDLIVEWFLPPIGGFFAGMWNRAQKKGHTHLLELYSYLQIVFDWLAYPFVKKHLLRFLLEKEVDRIIDVQNLVTAGILQALSTYNQKTGKNIVLEKVVLEFSTAKTTGYFRSIKKLKPSVRKYLKLITQPPLVHPYVTEEEFWRETCALSLSDIIYRPPLIREAFLAYQNMSRNQEPLVLEIATSNHHERDIILKTASQGVLHCTATGDKLKLTIDPHVKVVTLMLGSQPARPATLRYVDHFISLSPRSRKPIALFVFCANQKDSSFIESICARVLVHPEYPKHLSIVPMSYQTEAVIAPLYHRSDATITRSGGVTAMELLVASKGQIWIHTEKPLERRSDQRLMKLFGMPCWEEGNAAYLSAKKGARLVCPDTFAHISEAFFTS